MTTYTTRFGSLDGYEKGGVEPINDDPRNYVFSNMFEVASLSAPYEKVAVGKNFEYVLEVLRAEGTSGWRRALNDEFALVLDGEVEVRLVKLDGVDLGPPPSPESSALEGQPEGHGDAQEPQPGGSVPLDGEPAGQKMGTVRARRGHMALLPQGAAYQFSAERPGVVLLQTVAGRDTVERWSEICQTV